MTRTFVYFLQAGDDGPIKIGFSTDPKARMDDLQSTHYAILTLLGIFEGDEKLEQQLHRTFENHRIRGEWFHPHADVLAVVAAAHPVDIFRTEEPTARDLPQLLLALPTVHQNTARETVELALARTGDNVGEAAKLLGLSRRGMQKRMRSLGFAERRRGRKLKAAPPK